MSLGNQIRPKSPPRWDIKEQLQASCLESPNIKCKYKTMGSLHGPLPLPAGKPEVFRPGLRGSGEVSKQEVRRCPSRTHTHVRAQVRESRARARAPGVPRAPPSVARGALSASVAVLCPRPTPRGSSWFLRARLPPSLSPATPRFSAGLGLSRDTENR